MILCVGLEPERIILCYVVHIDSCCSFSEVVPEGYLVISQREQMPWCLGQMTRIHWLDCPPSQGWFLSTTAWISAERETGYGVLGDYRLVGHPGDLFICEIHSYHVQSRVPKGSMSIVFGRISLNYIHNLPVSGSFVYLIPSRIHFQKDLH